MNLENVLPLKPKIRQILRFELLLNFELFPISSLIGQFKILEKLFLKNFEFTNQRRGRENSNH